MKVKHSAEVCHLSRSEKTTRNVKGFMNISSGYEIFALWVMRGMRDNKDDDSSKTE